MKYILSIALFFSLLVVAYTALAHEPNTALSAQEPVPRTQDYSWMSLSAWHQRHKEHIATAEKGDVDVLFLGDSITHGWDWPIWTTEIAPLKAVNFGIGGDLTQNVIWRLENGGTGNLNPKVVSILIGVNNLLRSTEVTPNEVFLGVESVVNKALTSFPKSTIILQAIFPSGESVNNPNRARIKLTNQLLMKLSENPRVEFYDFGPLFLQPDGNISTAVMSDFLHPTVHGYRIYADALVPVIKSLLTNPDTVTIPASESSIKITGRTVTTTTGAKQFGFPGVSFEMVIDGGDLSVLAHSSTGNNHLAVYIDDLPEQVIILPKTPTRFPLLLDDGKQHTVKLSHRSETWNGLASIESFTLNNGVFLAPPKPRGRKIIFVGDSVTCGTAVERNTSCSEDFSWWNPELSYGLRIARNLNADAHLVCYGGRGLIRSWNGITEEAQAPEFYNMSIVQDGIQAWRHSDFEPQLILVSLGTNDFNLGLGPLPEQENYVATYVKFVQQLLDIHSDAEILLTEGAIVNDNADPLRPQKTVLRQYLAETVKRVNNPHVRFMPSKYYPGDSCDSHPTKQQHRAMADDFTAPLRHILQW